MRGGLERYSASGHKKVQGWLTGIAIDLVRKVGAAQERRGVTGPVCEIGVHHGRLFILLHLVTRPGETSVAWDLFERQQENLDRSGAGNEPVFRRNLVAHGCAVDEIRVETANSLDLTPEAIVATCGGKPRLFSVDGGHSAENTLHDLRLARASICDGGVVILDDFFNESWPGVAEGTAKFFAGADSGLVPFAIGGNKVLVTNNEAHAASYRATLAREITRYGSKKTSQFFGHEVLVVPTPPPTLRRLLAAKLRLQPYFAIGGIALIDNFAAHGQLLP
jgi:methyltransferase family protein